MDIYKEIRDGKRLDWKWQEYFYNPWRIQPHRENGVRFVGFEIDTEMYEVSNARLEREKAQLSLFDLGMERNGDE